MLARFQNIVRNQFKGSANKVPERESAEPQKFDCRLLYFCPMCEQEFAA